ncbi:MAG TPA: energy-coupling factor ABC transporter permease [Syntrophales bacterium]|nr:energy-coupling factor ABC transporter permease [Syntrophales bacterium]
MHIPGHMLTEQVEMVASLVALTGVGAAVSSALKEEKKPPRLDFARIVAVVFVLQMLNFPVQEGTSGHFLGGALAAATLGTNFGILAMSLVITVQTLLFGDGGITALGANICNMALIPVWTYAIVRAYLPSRDVGTAIAAWVSVVAAAFACGTELVISSRPLQWAALSAMVAVHSLTGVVEAGITMGMVKMFTWEGAAAAAAGRMKNRWTVSLFLVIVGILLAPFASPLPDGLEWVAERYRLFHAGMPAFVAPLHDYKTTLIAHEYLSSVTAACAGVVILAALSCALMTGLHSRRGRQG